MPNAKDQIIETTCALLEAQGYHATGLNQIVKESGTPKGSLYYYFPEGKESIAEEAIRMATGILVQRIRENLGAVADPAEAVRAFTEGIAHHIEASGFQSGGPLTTIALETATSSTRLNEVCRAAYEEMRQAFAEKLLAAGFASEQAETLSITILAAMEGGILLSRTNHSGDPLRSVGGCLSILIQSMQQAIK